MEVNATNKTSIFKQKRLSAVLHSFICLECSRTHIHYCENLVNSTIFPISQYFHINALGQTTNYCSIEYRENTDIVIFVWELDILLHPIYFTNSKAVKFEASYSPWAHATTFTLPPLLLSQTIRARPLETPYRTYDLSGADWVEELH